MGDANEGSKETPCPGCGVAIFQGQGVCAFCARRAAANESGRRARQIARGALLGLLLTGAAAVVAVRSWSYVDSRRSTPVTPEPLPPPPVVSVEVTRTAVLLNGKELFSLPPPAQQARIGLGPAGATAGAAESGSARLNAALKRARQEHRDVDGVDLRVAADTPAFLAVQVWEAAEAFEKKRLSVGASPAGPAATAFSFEGKDLPQTNLQVEVRTHGVSIKMRGQGDYFHNVGVGCVYDAPGLAVMLRKPEDYAELQRCFRSLRSRLPADALTRPSLTVLGNAPTPRLIYVINLMRCGELACPEEPQPRLWGPIGFGTVEEFHVGDSMFPIFMLRLEPALRACFETQRAQLSERSYETEIRFDVNERGQVSFTIQPGLPEPLELCASRVIEDAHLTLPPDGRESMDTAPLVFGDP